MWILLYFLMGIACYLLWKGNSPLKKKLLTLYWIQLFLNGLWSPAFFGMESPLLGLSIIVPLWILILTCVLEFRKANRTAAPLMIPYLLWATFATALNTSIWWLN
jgi:benzodiazapine receptor